MSTSNFPGYMEIKVEKFDGDTHTGEFNLSYDEIEKYFNLADGQIFMRVPNDFSIVPGMRVPIVGVAENVVVAGGSGTTLDIYMTGGSSKVFSTVQP